MKKHMVLLAGATLLAAMPMVASAGEDNPEGFYLSGNAQAVFPEDNNGTLNGAPARHDLDDGFGIGIAAGYVMPNRMRVEGEITYRDVDVDSTVGSTVTGDDVNSVSYMVNLLYDVDTNSRIVPYFGGGLGVIDFDAQDPVFAYQAMVGVGYDIGRKQEVYTGYRYLGSEGIEEDNTAIDYKVSNFEVGYRYHF